MIPSLWVALIAATVVSATSPTVLRPVLQRVGVVDIPNSRSSHATPTLRGGGLGPLTGLIAGGVVVVATSAVPSVPDFLVCALGAAAFSILGLVEDVRGLSVLVRGVSQILIGTASVLTLPAIAPQPIWIPLICVFFLAYYVNVANFMDGINGISGMHGIVAGLSYATIGFFAGAGSVAFFAVLVACVFGAFLPWNLSKRGLFLGDVGSYLLGGAVGLLAVVSALNGVNILAVLAPITIYAVDTGSALIRRILRGEPVLRPHRLHTYQRLTDTGLSHVGAALLVSAFSAGTSLIGLAVVSLGLNPIVAGIAIGALAAVYLSLPRMRGSVLPRPVVYALPDVEVVTSTGTASPPAPQVWVVMGASGFVGSSLLRHLSGLGYQVRPVSAPRLLLDPETNDLDTLREIAESSNALPALTSALCGADVVINAAGLATPDSAGGDALYGANALLPSVFAGAAIRAGVHRIIHISSAAVQGRRRVLDETIEAAPFSFYSHSKALGERAFLYSFSNKAEAQRVVVRATSVQGPGRATTQSLVRIAQSPIASVAAPGSQPTTVSTIDGLVEFITKVGQSPEVLWPILLQPWEGYTADDVLQMAGGTAPRRLPRWFCTTLLLVARVVGRVVPEIAGAARRLELMWMGQAQESSFPVSPEAMKARLAEVFAEERQ